VPGAEMDHVSDRPRDNISVEDRPWGNGDYLRDPKQSSSGCSVRLRDSTLADGLGSMSVSSNNQSSGKREVDGTFEYRVRKPSVSVQT